MQSSRLQWTVSFSFFVYNEALVGKNPQASTEWSGTVQFVLCQDLGLGASGLAMSPYVWATYTVKLINKQVHRSA